MKRLDREMLASVVDMAQNTDAQDTQDVVADHMARRHTWDWNVDAVAEVAKPARGIY